ncbi:MAG: hypothetical protein HY225_01525 [Candidatus Vogelbacteria bacterium]|nr:hypothetical protein [Candidatus Vogelbacteria bacterium]
MIEKLNKNGIEKSNLVPDTSESLWYANAIADLQKHAVLSNEEAGLVLYSRILTELKKLVIGSQSILPELGDSRDEKVNKAIELSIIISQVLSKEGNEDLIKAANSNKFRPIKISVAKGDILREKMAYVELTGTKELEEMEAKELASCKKIIDVLFNRAFAEDGAQNLANIFELSDLNPELAADLGKIIQAAELIALHRRHLEEFQKRDTARKEIIAKAKGKTTEKIVQPVLYIRDLLDRMDFGIDAKPKLKGFHERIKELEEKAALEMPSEAIGKTIN